MKVLVLLLLFISGCASIPQFVPKYTQEIYDSTIVPKSEKRRVGIVILYPESSINDEKNKIFNKLACLLSKNFEVYPTLMDDFYSDAPYTIYITERKMRDMNAVKREVDDIIFLRVLHYVNTSVETYLVITNVATGKILYNDEIHGMYWSSDSTGIANDCTKQIEKVLLNCDYPRTDILALAKSYENSKDETEKAMELFKEIIEKEKALPNNEQQLNAIKKQAALELSNIYEKQNNILSAIQILQKYAEFDPGDSEINNKIILLRKQFMETAEACFEGKSWDIAIEYYGYLITTSTFTEGIDDMVGFAKEKIDICNKKIEKENKLQEQDKQKNIKLQEQKNQKIIKNNFIPNKNIRKEYQEPFKNLIPSMVSWLSADPGLSNATALQAKIGLTNFENRDGILIRVPFNKLDCSPTLTRGDTPAQTYLYRILTAANNLWVFTLQEIQDGTLPWDFSVNYSGLLVFESKNDKGHVFQVNVSRGMRPSIVFIDDVKFGLDDIYYGGWTERQKKAFNNFFGNN